MPLVALAALLAASPVDSEALTTRRDFSEHRARELRDEAADSCWGGDEAWDQQSPAFLQEAPQEHWDNIQSTFGSGVEWLFRLMPGMRGKLYGRSLMPPCRCEACAYTLDTLIMFLDEDTMGWYTPDDIQHIMMDRFCYGIKWLYRSACHHILTAYFDDVAAMAMGHMTGLDICRVLRFCPYYYSGGNLWWSNMKAFPFFGAGSTTTANAKTNVEKLGQSATSAAGTASQNMQLMAPGAGASQQQMPPMQLPPMQGGLPSAMPQQQPPQQPQQPPQQQPPASVQSPIQLMQQQTLPPTQTAQTQTQAPQMQQMQRQQPPQQQPPQPQLGALRAAAEARQEASTHPQWEHSLSLLKQTGAQQQRSPDGPAPVGFHSNPAAQAASSGMAGVSSMTGGM